MPSKDDYHKKHPEVNEWLKRHGKKPRQATSAQIERLARRLDVSPDELAQKIPADTIRRTKYPVVEIVEPDGKRSFRHDLGVVENGRIAAR